MVLPNFLIVGAAKSGTTSLYEYLRHHPEVFMPGQKEPAYFAVPEAGGITSEEEYLALFRGADDKKAVGEASVAYLFDPGAPKRIRDLLGSGIKIIVILRNPVDMAYSNWGHQVREGSEVLTFEQALAAEAERISDPRFAQASPTWVANVLYQARARYAEQLSRYYANFSRENIKVLIFEEFFTPGLPQYTQVCRFLNVSDDHQPEAMVHNAAGTVRSLWLRRAYNERMIWKEPLKLIIPPSIRMKLIRLARKVNRVNRSLPELTPDLRRTLQQEFTQDVRKLEQMIGRDLSTLWF